LLIIQYSKLISNTEGNTGVLKEANQNLGTASIGMRDLKQAGIEIHTAGGTLRELSAELKKIMDRFVV
jgi:hypothetical protein